MKKDRSLSIVVLLCFIGWGCILATVYSGCSTDATTTAVNADAVVISGVNAAMTAWAAKVNSGAATQAQVTTVSNLYEYYYQAQIVASNLASLYVANPSTNLAGAEQTALAAAVASQTNLVAIINQLLK
jgi:hypothetical protein